VGKAIRSSNGDLKQAYSKTWEGTFLEFAGRTFNSIEPSVKSLLDKTPSSLNLSLKGFGDENVEKWVADVTKVIDTKGAEQIKLIDNHSKEWVESTTRAIVAEGVEAGTGAVGVARELKKKWVELSTFRAERIARTETIGAANAGSLAGAQDIAEEAGLKINKVWVTQIDGRTRDAHISVNNQSRADNKVFNVGRSKLNHPGDSNGHAEDIINCRCAMVYEVV